MKQRLMGIFLVLSAILGVVCVFLFAHLFKFIGHGYYFSTSIIITLIQLIFVSIILSYLKIKKITYDKTVLRICIAISLSLVLPFALVYKTQAMVSYGQGGILSFSMYCLFSSICFLIANLVVLALEKISHLEKKTYIPFILNDIIIITVWAVLTLLAISRVIAPDTLIHYVFICLVLLMTYLLTPLYLYWKKEFKLSNLILTLILFILSLAFVIAFLIPFKIIGACFGIASVMYGLMILAFATMDDVKDKKITNLFYYKNALIFLPFFALSILLREKVVVNFFNVEFIICGLFVAISAIIIFLFVEEKKDL